MIFIYILIALIVFVLFVVVKEKQKPSDFYFISKNQYLLEIKKEIEIDPENYIDLWEYYREIEADCKNTKYLIYKKISGTSNT